MQLEQIPTQDIKILNDYFIAGIVQVCKRN
jgi:hypothetical protein